MAATDEPRVATLTDKLLLLPHVGRVLAAVFYRILTYTTAKAKANKPFKDLVFAALRTNLRNITVAQEQFTIATSTEANYLDFAKTNNFQPETTVLNSGLRLHWLGPKTSEKVIIFFHGGGYALPCTSGHIQWLFDLQKELSKTKSTSVILVGYTLTPHAQYPEQLRQAAETLTWVLGKHGKKPADVIISGDSAGGNMALGLMSHLLHPHSDVNTVELSGPLASAVLISPWASFSTTDGSWDRNATSDMLPREAAYRWTSLFLGKKPADEYNEPVRASPEWFSGLDRVVGDVLIWGGGGEVLIDSINELAKILKQAHPKTEIVVQNGAAHEDFILDMLLMYTHKAEGTKAIESWIQKRY